VALVKIMIRLTFAAALVSVAATGLAVLGLGVATSRASTYGNAPWCAVVDQGAGNVMWECEYQSVAECTPNVLAGNRGFCQHNPYWQGASQRAWGPAPRYRHRSHQVRD
jgi:hypothetical protein